jgi:signal peptidase II
MRGRSGGDRAITLSQIHIRRTTKNALIFLLTAAAVILVDQVSKAIIAAQMEPGRSITAIPHVLSVTYSTNTGAAFGLFRGHSQLVFVAAALIIGLTLAWFIIFRKRDSLWTFIGLGLILGGALGNNLIDRVARGKVVDFIDLGWWPVFNVADIAIVSGVIIVLVVSAIELWREDAAEQTDNGGA